MIRMSLMSVGMVEDAGSVILVLRAPEQSRLLVMEIGLLEGRAIALEAESVKAPRPLTHQVVNSVMTALGASLAEVQIHDYRDKMFFANLVLTDAGGKQVLVDSRPSDAIALALHTGAPIFATPEVLETAGIDEEEALADDFFDDDPDDGEDEAADEVILH